ncbi:MAG: MFS transporter [Actinobacteria bacterium]|nr:MFS transporter [Actinomycetota bacterium]
MHPPTERLTHAQVLVVLSGLLLGMMLAHLDHTILATSLPIIVGELGGLDHLSWVVTAYMLATTVSAPLYGKLGDLYGRKRLFQFAIVVFLIGSVLCGLAKSMGQLVAFRAVQGLGGGGLMVIAQATVADLVAPRERGRYQSWFVATFAISSIIGPLLGGYLTEQASWRWVFYVNVPVGLVALIVTSAVLPSGGARATAPLDMRGAAYLTAGLSAVVLVMTWGGNQYAWMSPPMLGVAAVAGGCLIAFLRAERRAVEPVLPLRLFRNHTFNVAGAVSFLMGFAMLGTISFLPMFLQLVTGASATHSGLLLLPMIAGLVVTSTIAGQIVSRTGRYKALPMAGTLLAAVGMALLARLDATTPRSAGALAMVVFGGGFGLMMQVLVVVAQNAVHHRDVGVATSSVNFFRSIGGALGVTAFGAVFAGRLSATLPGNPVGGELSAAAVDALPAVMRADVVGGIDQALSTVFAFAVPVVLGAFVLTWLLREVPLRSGTPSHLPEPEGVAVGV